MKIIAEAGATKTSWNAIGADGHVIRFQGPGINASTMTESEISSLVSDAMGRLNPSGESVSEVHFYGAGVLGDGLASLFPEGEVECASDMLAAARAVCGHQKGIAAILGTGSNCCRYDGKDIVYGIRSGGFILGDEGGGASLGRLFLADFIKGLVPEEVAVPFSQDFEADYMTVVQNVYKEPAPSRYLGSFAPWILQHAGSSDYLRELVTSNFRNFFERSLCRVADASDNLPAGIVGGFASAAREYLMPLAQEYGISISGIYPDISDLLLRYHK